MFYRLLNDSNKVQKPKLKDTFTYHTKSVNILMHHNLMFAIQIQSAAEIPIATGTFSFAVSVDFENNSCAN